MSTKPVGQPTMERTNSGLPVYGTTQTSDRVNQTTQKVAQKTINTPRTNGATRNGKKQKPAGKEVGSVQEVTIQRGSRPLTTIAPADEPPVAESSDTPIEPNAPIVQRTTRAASNTVPGYLHGTQASRDKKIPSKSVSSSPKEPTSILKGGGATTPRTPRKPSSEPSLEEEVKLPPPKQNFAYSASVRQRQEFGKKKAATTPRGDRSDPVESKIPVMRGKGSMTPRYKPDDRSPPGSPDPTPAPAPKPKVVVPITVPRRASAAVNSSSIQSALAPKAATATLPLPPKVQSPEQNVPIAILPPITPPIDNHIHSMTEKLGAVEQNSVNIQDMLSTTAQDTRKQVENLKALIEERKSEEQDSPTPPSELSTKSEPTTPRKKKRVSFSASTFTQKLDNAVHSMDLTVPENFASENPLVQEMMKNLIAGRDEPVEFMETPEIEAVQAPRIVCETLNSTVLNMLFPSVQKRDKRTIKVDDDTDIDLEPINATPEQIHDFAFTPKELETVTRLSFFRTEISDDQFIALINRFYCVKEVQIALCPNVGDRSISNLFRLQRLISVAIRFCWLVTKNGIGNLPLEKLEDFALSTKQPIPPAITERLAKSLRLKNLDFNFCSNLSPEALACLKTIPKEQQVILNVKNCALLDAETVQELNLPIIVNVGPIEQSDRFLSGLPNIVQPPPLKFQKLQIFYQ